MLMLSNAETFLATLFHSRELSKQERDLAHWQEVKLSIENALRAEFLRRKNSTDILAESAAGTPVRPHPFLLDRDTLSNQCTLYIRNIQVSGQDSYHQLIVEWKEKNELAPTRDLSITRLYAMERKSYAACIQASSPEKMAEGLNRLLRMQ
jgi:hypothetical protein